MKKLEGTWAITTVIEGGHQLNAENQTNGIGRVVIKDGKMTMRYTMREAERNVYSLSIDPEKCPNGISLIRLDEKSEEIQNQPVFLGIYELKNGVLTICLGLDRPENFEAVSHPLRAKFVLKWAKR